MTRAIALLLIPAIGLSIAIVPAPFVRDSASGLNMHIIPDFGAGWLSGTAWIYDDAGRVTLGSHAALEDDVPGAFYFIGDLRVGDVITVVGDAGAVSYRVTDTRAVSRWDTSWMKAGNGEPTLTLITCTADSEWRFIVNAERIEADNASG